MNKVEFSDRIALLTNELYEANEYFLGYIHLYNKQVSNLDELNTAPGFFQLTLKAFLELFALKLARLFDDDKESLSLFKIPGWIEQSKELREALEQTKQEISSIQDYLADNESNIASLKLLRDKLLAHTDKKQLSRDIWHDAGITIQKYRCLISAAHEIICISKLMLDEPTPLLGMGIETDIDYLTYLLAKANDALYDEKVF